MRRDGYLKLLGEVRDLQLVDSEGRRCGCVDDIECEGQPGAQLRVKALLVGPGAYRHRLPSLICELITSIFGRRSVRVPWEEVEHITSVVSLKQSADDYGLMHSEHYFAALISKLPCS